MNLKIDVNGVWYHGSNRCFDTLEVGSTITQWRNLAEAFSHKPSMLSYSDNGIIIHNGQEKGYLYQINETIHLDADVYQHPRTTMDKNAEFLTNRGLKVKLIKELPPPEKTELQEMQQELERLMEV